MFKNPSTKTELREHAKSRKTLNPRRDYQTQESITLESPGKSNRPTMISVTIRRTPIDEHVRTVRWALIPCRIILSFNEIIMHGITGRVDMYVDRCPPDGHSIIFVAWFQMQVMRKVHLMR